MLEYIELWNFALVLFVPRPHPKPYILLYSIPWNPIFLGRIVMHSKLHFWEDYCIYIHKTRSLNFTATVWKHINHISSWHIELAGENSCPSQLSKHIDQSCLCAHTSWYIELAGENSCPSYQNTSTAAVCVFTPSQYHIYRTTIPCTLQIN